MGRVWVGIDNGTTGTIGIIFSRGDYMFTRVPSKEEINYQRKKVHTITRIHRQNLITLLTGSLAGASDVRVMIEKPYTQAIASQALTCGHRALEAVLNVVEDLSYPHEIIPASDWQKMLLPAGLKGIQAKRAGVDVCRKLFPQLDWDKIKDADGMLIAEYCRRMRP